MELARGQELALEVVQQVAAAVAVAGVPVARESAREQLPVAAAAVLARELGLVH